MKQRADWSLPVVLPVGIALVLCGLWLEGGHVAALIQGTAALIVFGGTLGAVLVSFPLSDVRAGAEAVRALFVAPLEPVERTIDRIVRYAIAVRRRGLPAIEDDLESEPDQLLRRGLTLAVEGMGAADIRTILEAEIGTREERHDRAARAFESAGGYAPTFGILGAVLGLVQVMQNLSDPARLGGGIAVAFVATVYGVGTANLLLLPLATRIRQRAEQRARFGELVLEGVLAVRDGQSPRVIAYRLGALAAPDRPPVLPSRIIHAA